jgi:quinohemoprotein ethanol dehydrogenase
MDDPSGLAAEPLVVDGVMYVSAPRSIVRAVDAATGKVLWTFDPHVRLDYSTGNSSISRVNRGVAVWEGRVYVGTGDGRLIAIDAAEGTQVWSSQVVDPGSDGISGAPRVAAGKVFIGHSGSDAQVRGSIAAFDAATGKEVWRFWTVPGDPALGFENKAVAMAAKTWTGKNWWKQGGGAVWDPITYDAKTGLLLFGTSKAFRGGGDDGQEAGGGAKLFSGSLIAVHADTGEYAWHYQTSTPERQTENFHIVLADLAIGGRARHVAMSAARNGTYYILDAGTGELISQKPLVKQEWLGPRMDYPGVVVNGVEDCKGNCFGVRNWWPMSYDPVTQLTYVPIMDRRVVALTHDGDAAIKVWSVAAGGFQTGWSATLSAAQDRGPRGPAAARTNLHRRAGEAGRGARRFARLHRLPFAEVRRGRLVGRQWRHPGPALHAGGRAS